MEVETTPGGLVLTFANISTSRDGSVQPTGTNGYNKTYGLGSWSGDSEVGLLACPDHIRNRPMAYVALGVYDPRPKWLDQPTEALRGICLPPSALCGSHWVHHSVYIAMML